jgi:hypothetical protein
MHSKYFTIVLDWERLSELDVTLLVCITRNDISATFSQGMVILLDNIGVEVVREMKLNETLILGISYTSSIVGLSNHIVESSIRNSLEFI